MTVEIEVTDVDEAGTGDQVPADLVKFDTDSSDSISEDEVVAAIVAYVSQTENYTEGEIVKLIVYFVMLP